GLGNSTTGYYVHRNDASSNPCSADFEGGLPAIRVRLSRITGSGDPVVAADPARSAIFIADTRLGNASTIGLFRNTASRLNSTSSCPNGTHNTNAASDRKSTRLNSSHQIISYAVFC